MKKKRRFTAKQRAAQKLFAKRARAGTLQRKKRKGKSLEKQLRDFNRKKRGKLCFASISELAHYMHVKGYEVVKK